MLHLQKQTRMHCKYACAATTENSYEGDVRGLQETVTTLQFGHNSYVKGEQDGSIPLWDFLGRDGAP